MNTKTLLAALVGAITFFLFGWLVYGILLKSFMEENFNHCLNRKPEEMIMWAMVVSNLFFGYLFSLIFSWAKINDFMSGLTKGAFLGLIFSAFIDFQFYAMTTWFNNITSMIIDIVVWVLMCAIGGGVIAYMLGRGNSSESA
ncbi:MAG: DUF1761 domain-containing protein [Bacteroidetes bacterium]|nr:DUF1761 domain-containing protein [Bacteroidota bacterium]